MDDNEENLVEAIDDGKIIKVSERYAKREGFPILRKPRIIRLKETATRLAFEKVKKSDEGLPLIEQLKNKYKWKQNQVITELLDNFHWLIRIERKKKGITRKQLAKITNESEDTIKKLEYGILPASDFVLINKVQNTLGINLRKDQKNYNMTFKEMLEPLNSSQQESSQQNRRFRGEGEPETIKNELYGNDIEILEDET